MSGKLRISVLGPLRAWSDSRPLDLGTARQRTVFAVLATAANRVVTAPELIATVWGPSPPGAARHNLHTYISGLRRSIATGVLESRPTGYLLRVEAGARDSERFMTVVAEALAREEAGDSTGAAAQFGDALRLWHGEPYAGLDGDLLELERAHLTRLRLEAVERRARILLEQGDDGLVAELSGLLHDHPLHEPLYELQMRALHGAGRSADALALFRSARAVLLAELGVEPGIRLQQLHRRILDGWPEHLSDGAEEVLRVAALLGPRFPADALIATAGRPPLDALSSVDEALAAGIMHETAGELAFRDPGVATSVRDGIPEPVRARQRRRIAETLARLGRPAVEVAAQLSAETRTADAWVLSWTVANVAEVGDLEPQLAARLSRLVLQSAQPTPGQREALLVAYVRAAFRAGEHPGPEARQALALATGPAHRAEMRHILAALHLRDGDRGQATSLLRSGLNDPHTPPLWRVRHRVMLAHLHGAGEPYDGIGVLQERWVAHTLRRDHGEALRYADRALELLGVGTSFAELHLDLLDNRIFSLQNLDRLDEAEQSLHEATLMGARHRLVNPLAATTAVQQFWTGRWNAAVAGISALADDAAAIGLHGRREPRADALLLHGVAALIAIRRDDLQQAAAHLNANPHTGAERENSDFLLVARAAVAERQGRPGDGLDILAPLLDPRWAPMVLRHQWLPDLLRSALRAGRTGTAERAAELCAAEAAQERTPARAWSALVHCRALMTGDPVLALEAAEHYRAVGRLPELAKALEDAAVLLTARDEKDRAVECRDEAAALYEGFGAHGDLLRLRLRLDEGSL